MKKNTLLLTMLFAFAISMAFGQTTVTKTYSGPTVTVDGCGNYCVALPGLTFTAADFPSGCEILDVNVSIDWLKTDGDCTTPLTGNSFHNETNFRIDGPSSQEILAIPGTWSGAVDSPPVTTIFDQAAAGIPVAGTPVSGTFLPNNGNLNNFNGLSALGTWVLQAGDTAGGDPLCISGYSVTITVAPDTTPPAFPDISGDGTLGNPFVNLHPAVVGNVPSGTYYFNFNGSTFQGELDNTNAGGAWLMILNYVHQGGTNPPLQVRNTDLPLLGASILGSDESGSTSWGHFGNILAADIDFEEMRFYGETSGHTRIIDFTTNYTPAINYAKTGVGSFSGINNPANYSLLANHTSSIPQNAPNAFTNQGDLALTNFPYWRSGQRHWGIQGLGNRWEVDDFPNNSSLSTIHRIWVRGDLSPATTGVGTTITVQLDGTGSVTVAGVDFGLNVTDNCSTPILSLSQTSFSCANIGNNPIQLTATDAAGNATTIDVFVIVEDNIDPVITCIADDTRDTDPGLCQYTVVGTEFDATFTDNCMSGSITNDLNGTDTIAGEILAKGDTTVIWIVDDGNGQTATCSTVITVEDNEDPVITCIADDTRDTDPGLCQYTVVGTEFDATFTDNCTDGSITNDLNGTDTIAGEILAKGDTTVIWTVDDGNGQTATCTTVITVEDNEDPTITCIADDTRDTDPGVCQYTVVGTEFDATFTDNCMDGSISNDLNGTATIAGEILAKGDTTVIWTVDDGNGQTATCTTVITVEDNEDPIITCIADDTRDTDPGLCQYTVVGTEFDATFTDNCPDGSITNDMNGTDSIAGEILVPGVYSVIWTVDDGNGQTATCTTVITVEDNEDPLIACPADVNANTDPGQCSTVVVFADALALDNCGVASVVQTAGLPSGSMFPVGVSTVEYTATDIHGNTSVCSFTITVTDNEPAMAVCQDITIQLDANGDAMIVAADVDGGSTDNCGVASIAIDMDTFDCSNVGPNNVTLSVTDVNGNVSSCIAVVTVEDVTVPDVLCMDITVQLDATGTVTIAGTDVDGGSTDACGIATYELDIDTFDCSNVGPNTVVLTVTDVNGNVSTCTSVVTVEDNIDPVLVCMDITLELGADGTATITPADVSTVTDACGVNTTAVDIENFDCSDIGTPVTVMVFAIDNNGNLASCNAVVTVVDVLAPVVTCPADVTVDPGPGNLFYELPDYFALGEATAEDNCTDPLTLLSQDPVAGTLLPDGVYTITMTAEDEYGNIGTCTFELTIESVLGIGDNDLSIASIVMYPNPAKDVVMLSNPQSIALEQATIYDLTGRLIQTIDLTNMGTEKVIDVSELAAATYVVVIQSEQGQITKQLLKE